MFGSLRHTARMAARRTAFGLGAALMLLVGLAFLTVAAWLALSAARDALFAATVIGAGYFGLGLILLALSARRGSHHTPRPVAASSPAEATLQGLAGAFMQGVGAGMVARASIRKPPPPPRNPAD